MRTRTIPSGLAKAGRILRWAWLVMRQMVQAEGSIDLAFAPTLWPWFYWGVEEALESHQASPWEARRFYWINEWEGDDDDDDYFLPDGWEHDDDDF